jgi:glycosyltransferase involved in cell wall biosynthesis
MSLSWLILTGEYPPNPGGVADYTKSVAEALRTSGDEVIVACGPAEASAAGSGSSGVLRLPDCFAREGLNDLAHFESSLPGRFRVLVQYVPHNFGMKSMNLPLVRWLQDVSHRRPIDVMFHEVMYPREPGQRLRLSVLSGVHGWMAKQMARVASRLFVSIPGWASVLSNIGVSDRELTWLPIPSNLPRPGSPEAACELRRSLVPEDARLVGSFGSFGPAIRELLAPVLPGILAADGSVHVLLVGRGAQAFAATIFRSFPGAEGRIHAAADVDALSASHLLCSCDVLLQPYPDGASTRRSSLMAGLAMGIAVVSNRGQWTEALWEERDGAGCRPMELADSANPSDLAEAVQRLLQDPSLRHRTAERGRQLYDARFDLRHTVRLLRSGLLPGNR